MHASLRAESAFVCAGNNHSRKVGKIEPSSLFLFKSSNYAKNEIGCQTKIILTQIVVYSGVRGKPMDAVFHTAVVHLVETITASPLLDMDTQSSCRLQSWR